MILATVVTCPERWVDYQRFRKRFDALRLPCPLRTFQTIAHLGDPMANNNLNARAAIAFADRYLPSSTQSWLLYLEDDVFLRDEISSILPVLTEIAEQEPVDCWYLCNRKNPVKRQYASRGLVIHELAEAIEGTHGLFIPKRHLTALIATHWGKPADRVIFGLLGEVKARVLQVVSPVLAEHRGFDSTFCPNRKSELEVNYANQPNSY